MDMEIQVTKSTIARPSSELWSVRRMHQRLASSLALARWLVPLPSACAEEKQQRSI